MGRQLKSKTRTISNRGEMPRFIGYYLCMKAKNNRLHFDSLTSLYVGRYFAWLKRIKRMDFEPRQHSFRYEDKTVTSIPDFEGEHDTGWIEYVEAKYSPESLSDEDRCRLKAIKQHFANRGNRYQVVFRTTLERRGFIQTICLLRRYGDLNFPEQTLKTALETLASPTPKTLREYRILAVAHAVRVSVLYHLVYHKQLRIRYELPRHEELELCRGS